MKLLLKVFLFVSPFIASALFLDDDFESNRQVIIRDEKSAAHVLVSASADAPMQRLVVALPPMNSAAAVQFTPRTGESDITAITAIMSGTPETFHQDDGYHGVKVDVEFSGPVLMNNTVAGSARTVRDFVEGGLLWWTENEEEAGNYFSYNFIPSECVDQDPCIMESEVQFRQLEIVRKFFTSPDEVRIRVNAPEDVLMTVQGERMPNGSYNVTAALESGETGPFVMTFRIDTNIEALVGIEKENIFNEQFAYLLEEEADRSEQLAFLSWESGWVAGSWRFLTYFGRDTLLSLAMMQDKVQWDIQRSVLGAAIARIAPQPVITESEGRTDPEGAVCHEDNLGDYAQWNGGNEPHKRTWVCDYKMVDTDYLLLPVLAKAAKNYPAEVMELLEETSTYTEGATYEELLRKNIQLVLDSATPFVNDPKDFENLIPIRHVTVGNWRDSNEGLGWGQYAFDVNGVLVPAALRAIDVLIEANIISLDGLNVHSEGIAHMAKIWETDALEYFRVRYGSNFFVQNKDDLDQVVQDYATAGPGMDIDISPTLQSSTADQLPTEYFFAVSLLADGRQVPVLNTDIGFLLFFRDDVSEADVLECIRAASVPFPRGLRTDVGLVVANPAYAYGDHYDDTDVTSEEKTVTNVLGRAGYHGTVVWSWQQALLLQGFTKYYEQGNSATEALLEKVLADVWEGVDYASSHQNAEMWGFDLDESGAYSIVDFGVLTGGTTEGNMIQLWSYAFMGMRSRTTTTAAPVTTTAGPITTTAAPVTTTAAPVTTTAGPITTTAAPVTSLTTGPTVTVTSAENSETDEGNRQTDSAAILPVIGLLASLMAFF